MCIFLTDVAVWSPTSCWNYATTCNHDRGGACSRCRQVHPSSNSYGEWRFLLEEHRFASILILQTMSSHIFILLSGQKTNDELSDLIFFFQIPSWLHQRSRCRLSFKSSISWASSCQKLQPGWLLGAWGAGGSIPICSRTPLWGKMFQESYCHYKTSRCLRSFQSGQLVIELCSPIPLLGLDT